MPDSLGRSLYLSETDEAMIHTMDLEGRAVFLSLHRQEEMNERFAEDMKGFLKTLNERRCRIIADVSKHTLKAFEVRNLNELIDLLSLYAVRPDYGFALEEINATAKRHTVVINASTMQEKELRQLSGRENILAMHNFYPRPETGLDEDQLKEKTELLHSLGMKVAAFIPGSDPKRGLLKEGLPTLENHRYISPYAALADLLIHYDMDEVFLGDPEIDPEELARMDRFLGEGVIELPCQLLSGYESLYDRIFTCRIDSPSSLIRAAESREYSMANNIAVRAEHTVPRVRGSVTMDNEAYLRYCGEVMITRKDLPEDARVNVIGRVSPGYLSLLDCIKGGARFVLRQK
ncbi:MAG: DUF871 domain-containing protein [Solobacterium sp.]|nr:DUF871 domain-containing protein [Solobacterium sp.]